jgi:hypothetical protein
MSRCIFKAENFFKQKDRTLSQRMGLVPVRFSPCALHNRFKCVSDNLGVIFSYSPNLKIGIEMVNFFAGAAPPFVFVVSLSLSLSQRFK